ncbi:hypothetical protein LAZ67_3002566 [Cordylochernes scorpioides]|uniref:Uncharacterized protein n=1 Tax=Cordylochernes scorpioides TaxID=51811 RepID=A0ABY6K8I4_9ARAC|nr:hypothetical protein LAZ67_3002566 [Cordylochernes scorpioides]
MPGHRKRRQFKQTDAFTRGMVIGLKRAGWSLRQIAADTHLGASTVHRLWRRWLEQGNVAIYRNAGATRVTSARVDRRILRQAVAAPQATCTAILQHVQDTLDHSISTRTISRRLIANGLHSCRPLRRLPLTPTNRRQRLEWCRARSTWMTEWHRVVFSDESRFCLSSDSRRVRVWRRRGERSNPAAIVERPIVRQRGIMVWGAIAYDSRSPLLRIQGTMTAQRYVDDVLRPVTLPYLQGVPNALYQQDNARPHTARISQQALQDVQMLPWPPYSPDLSPIEHVWDIIGRRLHASPQPHSEDELWQMVEREWRAIPQDAIRTLIDSLPRRVAACIAVRGFNSTIQSHVNKIIKIKLSSIYDHFKFETKALIVKDLSNKIPNFYTHNPVWPHLNNLKLADPEFYIPRPIDIIIGADLYLDLVEPGLIKGPRDAPSAMNSKLGWIISGRSNMPNNTTSTSIQQIHVNHSSAELDDIVKKCWDAESIPTHKEELNTEELECENIFRTTTFRDENGRYVVSLPFKLNYNKINYQLGDSKSQALRRFLSLERRFHQNPVYSQHVREFMQEYLNLGHMEVINEIEPEQPSHQVYYMPYHAVLRDQSTTTKLRVVFDASAKTSTGLSLNDLLYCGPKLQEDIFNILIKFRTYSIALTAVIEKMYRQIRLNPADCCFQRILWRASPNEPIKEYQLATVTYGTTSAPYLAIKTLKTLAHDEQEQFPQASKAILTNFYVNDMLSGENSVEEAKDLIIQLNQIMRRGGFHLRKWASNVPKVLEALSNEDKYDISMVPIEKDLTINLLGLIWNATKDVFQVKVQDTMDVKTKRQLLSVIAQFFDPLRIISPSIILLKILMQDAWKLQLDWVDYLPDDIVNLWAQFKKEIGYLSQVMIPRYLAIIPKEDEVRMQLHGFADASAKAYAAVCYLRCETQNDVKIQLLAAKTRVASLNAPTLPCLELCAAHLLSQLVDSIKLTLPFQIKETFLWTDSKITLCWIQSNPTKWKVYISNRVEKIQKTSRVDQWHHVPGVENPADCASRGIMPSKLVDHYLWWNGPSWLTTFDSRILSNKASVVEESEIVQSYGELIQIHYSSAEDVKSHSLPDSITRFSSYSRMKRTLAWCLRFINNSRYPSNKFSGTLTTKEIRSSELKITKVVQECYFSVEINALLSSKTLPKTNKLLCLNPFIDQNGILRVGGRLKLSSLRTYWIINGRSFVKQILKNCVQCFKVNARPNTQLMGELPSSRTTYIRAFARTGVDLAGPILTKPRLPRSRVKLKSYIALFVCFATKAIHLELVSDLSTGSFIAALRRFTSRRGTPSDIYSDNGTNFKGAAKFLNEQYALLHASEIQDYITYSEINWHFMPPHAPHFGGIWESNIKSVKMILKKVIGSSLLTFEEFTTFLTQIEATLNQRPLTPLSEDPNDLEALTPAHFLSGPSTSNLPETDNQQANLSINLSARWKHIQELKKLFILRWKKEYVINLQKRGKWKSAKPNVKIGDLVLIMEQSISSSSWILGRVSKTFPGPDMLVRTVELRTGKGLLRRPVNKVAVLPVQSDLTLTTGPAGSMERIPLLEAEGKVEFPCQTERRLKAILQAASCGRKDVKLSCKQRLVEGKTSSYPASSVLWKERRQAILQAASCGRRERIGVSLKQKLESGKDALDNQRVVTIRQPTRDNWTSHKTSQTSDGAATRKAIRGTFTRIINEINGEFEKSQIDRNDIYSKFNRLESYYTKLVDLNEKYQALLVVKEGITEESIDKEWQECDKYEEEKFDIQQKVSVLRNPDKEETIPIASEDTVINVKLPELALKSYDGSLEGWLPWWAQFSKIHENKNLSDSDRFLYLRQAIVPNSEAYRVVASYPVTGANYVLAVQALQERFGDPNILTELYVRRLLNSVITNVKKENRNLSSLYDELSSHLRSLETLGIDPQFSGIFLYPLVESSLPSDILKIWHRHPSSGYGLELAKREESDKGVGGAQERLRLLLDFLKAEVRSAQRLKFVEKGFKQEEPYKRSYNDGTRTRNNFRPATVSSLFGGRTNIKCFFCERTNHASHQCRSIMKMSPGERNDKIRSAHLCFKCLRKGHIQSQCREQLECKNCGRNHLEVLCEGNSSNRLMKPGRENLKENAPEPIASLSSQACTGQVLLMTTVALLRGPNASRRVRILLDSGSQFSYIKQSLVWSIGIERKGEITIAKSLFGGNKIGEEKHGKFMLELENLGNKRDVIHIEALDQRKICDAIPPLPKGDWLEKLKIKGIILSQDNFKGQEIDILIGANYLGMVLTGKIVQVEADLTAVETKLGWTLMGNSPIIDSNDNVQQTLNLLITRCDLKDLWDLEVLGIRDPVETCSIETRYQEIKEKFITKIQRQSDQRYSVGLPWKVEKESIPSNLDIAIKRLDISTKKMTSQNKLTEYSQIFRDWLTEGLIERVEENPLERRGYYLPHRPVYKMESKTTPIRPVFDASCLGHNGLSLNQCLEKGPNLLERIPEMMIRFRENKFGVTADIRKAFQMVAIEESERNYLRFLWWEKESDKELIAYRHKRLVFGLNCSPFVLNAVIEYHLQSIRGPLVQWAKILAQSFYMDNCITSLETKQEVQEFQKAAIEIMDRAKMDLREWEYSLEENPEKGTCTKILGVVWNKMEDSLKCELPDILSLQPKLTKRLVLSMVQRIFDPLGFCAPVFLPPKLLLQRSWGLKLGWDTPLPESMAQEFRTWLDQIKFIELIKIPRYMWNDLIFPTEVHIFCDASQIGYGAVAYLRSETGRENTLTLIWSKVRLAPMKSITIPRLELMAMVLGARLANAIQAALKRKCETTLWSDSTTALSWIKKEIEWRVFVRNRIREIQATTNLNDWRFVPSQLNPADLLSRGCPPSQFVQSRWWEGPEWLKKPKEFWPNSEFSINPKEINVEENIMKTNINLNIDYKDWLLTRRSNYSLNIRVMSYVLRFLGKLKKQSTETGPLKVSELDLAEKKLIRMIQEKVSIEKSNATKSFKILKNTDGLWCVESKLLHGQVPEEFKTPIILPGDHPFVEQLIWEVHLKNGHVGVQFILSKLREKFWIIRGRKTIKKIISKCIACKRLKEKSLQRPMAALPENRIGLGKPFQITGVDLLGPLHLKEGGKVWVAAFTCAVYRAIHLELVKSLETGVFMMALHRFICRRGRPEKIYSDNGTNFAKLNRIFKRLDWTRIERETSIKRIQWIFIPPSAPWWGGFWERMVRTIKEMLIKMLGHRKLKYVQLQTALCEIESIINNRPLTYVSEDDNDLKPLTPNEFLQNGPESSFPEFENLKPEMLHTRYRELGRIVNLIPGKDGIVRVAHVKTSTGTLIRALQRLHPLEISSNVETIQKDNSNTEPQSESFLGNRPNIESRDSRNRYGRIAPAWTDRGQRSAWAETTERRVTFFFWSVGRIPLLEAEGKVEFPCQTERRLKAILQAASCGRKDVKLSCKQRLVEGKTSSYPASSVLWKERRQDILQAASCGRRERIGVSLKQKLESGKDALDNQRVVTIRQPTRDNWTSHKTSQTSDGAATRYCVDTPPPFIFISLP